MEILPGKWVVCEGRFGGSFTMLFVHEITDSTFTYVNFGKKWRKGKSCVVFCGNERAAQVCLDTLTQGYAEFQKARDAVVEQWEGRKATIIASSALTPAK